ncbi:Abi-domain-containing [Pyrrhoderma noxium]|uniref:intramembrane prenyl-peptidase Rce1 n=1 Tax=Pyrrhoderma noxium TaxID=2282107 RepID=A0A286UDY8_9AGAM|nr:Abi-domain-containing [Pyrrhoderma noxium]
MISNLQQLSVSEHRLSQSQGFWLAGLVASSYVGSVYVSLLIARPRPPLWRNEPAVIKARSLLASFSSILCCSLVYFVARSASDGGIHEDTSERTANLTSELLGLSVTPYTAYLVVPALFIGPLYTTYLAGTLPFQQNWNFQTEIVGRLTTWEGIRNYVMAPISEEVTYRACVLSIYHLAGYNRKIMIWFAPCWFGLAHIHHAFEMYKRLGRTSSALQMAFFSSAFQFLYTTVFGWLCSFLFLRTASIFIPISAHIFCNIMGFPAIGWELREYPNRKYYIILAYISGVYILTLQCFRDDVNLQES